MEITEVRIKLMEDSEDRLRAFCSITFDHCFVVRDLKIIDGVNGPFVAMPSRKLTGHCQKCGHKNHLRANYCNQCGIKLRISQESGNEPPQKLYADVAHPINSACREMIQCAVIDELEQELARAGEPGYRSRYDDDFLSSDIDELEISDQSLRAGSSITETPPMERATTEGMGQQPRPEDRAGGPPAPHFDRRPAQDRASSESRPRRGAVHDEEDSFGAGIFD